MNFLLLGIDSLIAAVAICPLVSPRARVPLAALFGVADGLFFLAGAGLGWHLAEGLSTALLTATFVAFGLYLLVVAARTRQVAVKWPLWVLPFALTLDNLTYGAAGGHQSLLSQATEQALSSALLALAGLLVAVALPRMATTRLAGGALVLAAGGLVLLG
jgi:hypothetical protein